MGSLKLFPYHWASLIDGLRSGAVRNLRFYSVDLSALDDDAFLDALGCRGLLSLVVERSDVPSGFAVDVLVPTSVAKGLTELSLRGNKSDTPPSVSEDIVLGFFFRADAGQGRQTFDLKLEGSGVTEKFLAHFFKVLLWGRSAGLGGGAYGRTVFAPPSL